MDQPTEPAKPFKPPVQPVPAVPAALLGRALGLIRVQRGRLIRAVRRPTAIMAALMSVGLILVGMGIGRLLFPMRTVSDTAPIIVPTSLGATRSAVVMPDIAGQTVDQANRVLTDSGLISMQVAQEVVPQAGPPGLVITQTPSAGSTLPSPEGVAVALKVSGPGLLPNVIGKSVQVARDELAALGVIALFEEEVRPDQPPGQVLSSMPAAGASLTAQVMVRVSSAGDAVYLAGLRDVAHSGCSGRSSVVVNGQTLRSSLLCSVTARQMGSIEYSLGRHAVIVEASVGIPDKSPGRTATVTFLGDGKAIGTFTAAAGATAPVRVSVKGVLKMRIEVATESTTAVEVAVGEARAVGTPSEIDILTTQSS